MATRAETHERILLKAQELFARFGATRASIADIARELRMSPANIYKSFPSKLALMEAVGARQVAEQQVRLLTITQSERSHFERIEALITNVSEWLYTVLRDDKDFIKLELMRFEANWQFVHAFHDFLRGQMADLIRGGIAAGTLRETDPPETAAALLDCLVRAIEPLLLMQDPPEVRRERLARQFRLLAKALQ